jgi:recombination protein RecA
MADVLSLEEKKKILGKLVTSTQKKFGGSKHALSFAKDRVDDLRFEYIPTPSQNVNAALNGGWARGRIGEVAGENSSGKTSLMLETISDDMRNDPTSMWGWFETENSFDPDYAFGVKGIDPDRLMVWDMGDNGAESGLDTLEMLIRSNALKGVVVNSVTGLTPKKELDNNMEKQEVAIQARMMSKLMRKIVAISGVTRTAVIFINQLRTNVGVMYGDPNTTTGGKALAFFSSQRINLRKVKVKAEDGITEEQGIKINVKVAKNRCAYDNPYKATSYTALFGEGIDVSRELADILLDTDLIEKAGAWIYMPTKAAPDQWVGQDLKFSSKSNLIKFIKDHPLFADDLKTKLHGKIKVGSVEASEIDAIQTAEQQLQDELGDLAIED